jgi:hypothetical protein
MIALAGCILPWCFENPPLNRLCAMLCKRLKVRQLCENLTEPGGEKSGSGMADE